MPEMQMIDSTMIEAVGYEPDTQQLHVRFAKSGDTYVYYAVEEWVFSGMLESESKGQYFNATVRDAYQFEKL